MGLIVIYTAVANIEDARKIAQSLVTQKLVACAQISNIESIYTWEDAVQQEAEYSLSLKTTAANYALVETAIRQMHPYVLPEIYAVPVTQAFEPYAQWVTANSSEK